MMDSVADYRYQSSDPTWTNTCLLWPSLERVIGSRDWPERHAFDLGCGNGATGNMLSTLGFRVTGVDLSKQGIEIAHKTFPDIHVRVGSAYDDLAKTIWNVSTGGQLGSHRTLYESAAFH
jgi:2-polyprenyl-3-methyl-5-hydroxy-6-metoxy-1,4-benzoquinol methylase